MTADLLAGVRVVEFGNLIAAPYAGMLLADLGADVIKVEPPAGDLGRQFGPHRGGESVFFMAVNRGKRSLAIDPKHPAGRAWLERLVAGADVVLNNLRHGAMERMGLGAEAVQRLNPTAVYAVVSAFGSDGPQADRPGIDVIFQAESGMVSITGHPGDPPQKTATTIGDYVAATNAAFLVTAALVDRHRTGRGRTVDVTLRDGLLAVQSGWWALFFESGRQPERTGTASPYLAPNQIFRTSDGHLALAIVSDRHFRVFCEEIDRPDLRARYPTNDTRMAARSRLAEELEAVFQSAPTEEWITRLGRVGVPVGRVMDFGQVAEDRSVRHNQMIFEYTHPVAGQVSAVGSPLRVEGTPARAASSPPTLGQHSVDVLVELGADSVEIDRLVREGVVVVT